MNKKILITGGCGFIGHHFVEHFLKNTNWEIIVLDKLTYASNGFDRLRDIDAFDEKRVRVFTADLQEPISDGLAKEIGKVDYVLNLASESHVDRSIENPVPFILNNVKLVLNVLEWAREARPKKIVSFSTDECVGVAPEGVNHKEDAPHNPSNPYCLLPGTKVITKQGLVNIQDIAKGQKVFARTRNSLGEATVLNKFEYDYDGEVIVLKTTQGEIVSTPEHKFFKRGVIWDKNNNWGREFGTNKVISQPHLKIIEVPAKDLKEGDYVLMARYISHYSISNNKNRKKKPLYRFLGYFLGDGNYSKKSKYVKLADEKLDFLLYYRDILKDYLGVSKKSSTKQFGTIYKHSTLNCYYLQFASKKLRDEIDLSDKKNILKRVGGKISKENIAEFLAGFFDAEAYFHYVGKKIKDVQVFQANYEILLEIQFLLRKLGIISRIKKERNGWKILISDNLSLQKIVKHIPSLKIKKETKFFKGQHKHWNKKFYWARIIKKGSKRYRGKVYDLETDKSNYCANYFIVHNSASKASQEDIVRAYANTYQMPIIITRTMNVIGERQHPEKFVPLVIRKVLKGEKVYIHADPTKTKAGSRFYIHARNVAQAIHFILKNTNEFLNKDDIQSGVFNIVGEKEIDNLTLAKFIADIVGKPLKYELVDFHSSRPGHDLRYALDGSKLKNYGFEYPKTLEESLEKTIKWYLKPENKKWLEL